MSGCLGTQRRCVATCCDTPPDKFAALGTYASADVSDDAYEEIVLLPFLNEDILILQQHIN